MTEAADWFVEPSGTSGVRKLLLLIGGPGAGKSHVTRGIVRNLRLTVNLDSDLAHRRYDYAGPNGKIVVINDATIPSDNHPASPLCSEIDEAYENSSDLVACVNRGILVEELLDVEGADHLLGHHVLSWAQGNSYRETDNISIRTIKNEDYIKVGQITQEEGGVLEVVAVYADVCSLFEKKPAVSGLGTDSPKLEKYEIHSPNNLKSWSDSETIAGSLLSQVMDFIGHPDSTTGWDPIAANVASLRTPAIRRNWIRLMRAAEVASGQKYTYRELWGAIVRSLVGDLPHKIDRTDLKPLLSFQGLEDALACNAALTRIIGLTDVRWTQALFGALDGETTNDDKINRDPVVRLTHTVDPMRDALPGDPWSSGHGWFDPVAEAIAGSAEGLDPLQTLRKLAPHGQGEYIDSWVTEFDSRVNQWFHTAMTSEDTAETDKHLLRNWYASYLGRVFATSYAITGFREATEEWVTACELVPNLPSRLKDGLDVLLRPLSDPDSSQADTLVPLFESRTVPIVGRRPSARFAMRLPGFHMSTERRGEVLELSLKEKEVEKARMIIDFALIREALAAAENFAGLTEMSNQAAPRLERFRSAQLKPDSIELADFHLVGQELRKDLQISFHPTEGVSG